MINTLQRVKLKLPCFRKLGVGNGALLMTGGGAEVAILGTEEMIVGAEFTMRVAAVTTFGADAVKLIFGTDEGLTLSDDVIKTHDDVRRFGSGGKTWEADRGLTNGLTTGVTVAFFLLKPK